MLLLDNMLENGKSILSENFSNFKFLQIIMVLVVHKDLFVIYFFWDSVDEFREYSNCIYWHFSLLNIINSMAIQPLIFICFLIVNSWKCSIHPMPHLAPIKPLTDFFFNRWQIIWILKDLLHVKSEKYKIFYLHSQKKVF